MEKLRIEYDHGYMELNVEAFFPCTRQKARIVFPLIGRWCSKECKEKLLRILTDLADGYRALCQMYAQAATSYPVKSVQCRHYTAEFRKTQVLYKRMNRNIEFLTKEVQNER